MSSELLGSSRMTVKSTPSQCNMSAKLISYLLIFLKLSSAIFALSFRGCFRTSDRACFRDSPHLLRSIFSASKCSWFLHVSSHYSSFMWNCLCSARDQFAKVFQMNFSSCIHLHLHIRHKSSFKKSFVVLQKLGRAANTQRTAPASPETRRVHRSPKSQSWLLCFVFPQLTSLSTSLRS